MTESNEMRVLHLTTSFPLQSSSVSGIFIYRLVSHFPVEVLTTILTPADSKSANVSDESFILRTFRYSPKRWQTLAHEPGGLPAAIARSKYYLFLLPSFFLSMLWQTMVHAKDKDVIHAHWTINGIIAGIGGKLTRTPVITTLRGEDVNRGHSSLLHRLLLKGCLRFSDIVVTVSSTMFDDITARFPQYKSKIFFVPNGVSDKFFDIGRSETLRKPRILVLGSLIPRKGVDIVINALLPLEDLIEYELIIAGAGPEKEKLQGMVQKGQFEASVQFVGQLSADKIVSLFKDTDILIQASYMEGRPNSVVEAMAAEVAVIGSDIDGINELIENGKNGLLFPPGDVLELSRQLQLLLESSKLRKQLGQAARQTILDHNLTWSKCIATYIMLYQRLIRGKSK